MNDTARVHPSTITAFSEGRVGAPIPRKRHQPRKRADPMTYLVIDERVWKTALRAADGDALRIKVISPTEVVVLNHRK